MPASLRSFRRTLIAVWLAGTISGLLYAYSNSIALRAALPVLVAFLIELSFYVSAGFESVRRRLDAFPRRALALAMTAGAGLSYTVYAAPAGCFDPAALGAILLLGAALSFWYVVLPRRRPTDVLFLCLVAAVVLGRVLRGLYASPAPRVPMETLGQLMWIRTGMLAVLLFRRVEGAGFGFLPSRRDWAVGVRYFLIFIPAGVLLGLAIGFARFDPHPVDGWRFAATAAATFFGMLWIVALPEEFFFRGLLQNWLAEWLKSRRRSLLLASVLFGLAHLPFRAFPNWKMAVLATLAGLFYGHAYLKTGGIRAPMVTHALVNTAWRVLFS